MDEDTCMLKLLPFFLVWKFTCFLFRQFFWWLMITMAVVFILRARGIFLNFEIRNRKASSCVHIPSVLTDDQMSYLIENGFAK